MSRTDLAADVCTLARTAELFGDAWTLTILRELFLGTRRFDELLRQTGASPHILSQRLKRLVAAGILRREAYSDHAARYDYRLTEKGRAIWPVVIAMKAWGDEWLGDGASEATPVAIEHKGCGHVVVPRMTCPDCGAPMAAHDATPHLSQPFAAQRAAAGRHK
jgi:DNA-binding HxlR family transcriptional regulator